MLWGSAPTPGLGKCRAYFYPLQLSWIQAWDAGHSLYGDRTLYCKLFVVKHLFHNSAMESVGQARVLLQHIIGQGRKQDASYSCMHYSLTQAVTGAERDGANSAQIGCPASTHARIVHRPRSPDLGGLEACLILSVSAPVPPARYA